MGTGKWFKKKKCSEKLAYKKKSGLHTQKIERDQQPQKTQTCVCACVCAGISVCTSV